MTNTPTERWIAIINKQLDGYAELIKYPGRIAENEMIDRFNSEAKCLFCAEINDRCRCCPLGPQRRECIYIPGYSFMEIIKIKYAGVFPHPITKAAKSEIIKAARERRRALRDHLILRGYRFKSNGFVCTGYIRENDELA